LSAGSFENINLIKNIISHDKNKLSVKTLAIISGNLLVIRKTSVSGTFRYNLLSFSGYQTIPGTID